MKKCIECGVSNQYKGVRIGGDTCDDCLADLPLTEREWFKLGRGRWRDKGTGGKGKGLPPNPKCVDCGVEKNDDNTRKNGEGRYESYCRVCKRHRTSVYKSRISTINRLRGV